jgi:ABC-type nitrate/sulfonate/bicarbonate transport system substrate-binding protein
VKFTAGPPFFSAFQSGSIDVGYMGFQPAVTAIAQGIPIKIIALENDAWGAEGLVVRPDSGIKTLADMRGKTIATKRGS